MQDNSFIDEMEVTVELGGQGELTVRATFQLFFIFLALRSSLEPEVIPSFIPCSE